MASSDGFFVLPPSFVPGNGPAPDYDVWIAPFLRDLDVILPGVLFFFAAQFTFDLIGRRFPRYRAMSRADQVDWCVRGVAALNGAIAQYTTYLWLSYLWAMPADFAYDMYTPLPGYREPLALLIAYFLWDGLVCVGYGWSWAYTTHAVASGVGMYLCSFPCSALWSPYYSGLFELGNVFYHGACMLRGVADMDRPGWHRHVVALGDGVFAVWFLGVRIVGGVVTSTQWIWMMSAALMAGTAHSVSAGLVMIPLFASVIALQLFWAGAVFQGLRSALSGKKVDASKLD